jgi:antitoxin component of MazEF toxin-antitoxin module
MYIYFGIYPYKHWMGMSLTRKTRVSGSSIVVTIPSQLVEAFDINNGDLVEIIPLRNGEIRIRKANNHRSRGGTE